MVALSGNLLSQITCALPQSTQEKLGGPKLEKDKVTCLTRGNGHAHIMVIIGLKSSWDLEALSMGTSIPRPETRWISLILATLWTCLLISVSGLKQHAWFLVALGAIGNVANHLRSRKIWEPSASDVYLSKFSRAPRIITLVPPFWSFNLADFGPNEIPHSIP